MGIIIIILSFCDYVVVTTRALGAFIQTTPATPQSHWCILPSTYNKLPYLTLLTYNYLNLPFLRSLTKRKSSPPNLLYLSPLCPTTDQSHFQHPLPFDRAEPSRSQISYTRQSRLDLHPLRLRHTDLVHYRTTCSPQPAPPKSALGHRHPLDPHYRLVIWPSQIGIDESFPKTRGPRCTRHRFYQRRLYSLDHCYDCPNGCCRQTKYLLRGPTPRRPCHRPPGPMLAMFSPIADASHTAMRQLIVSGLPTRASRQARGYIPNDGEPARRLHVPIQRMWEGSFARGL